MSDSLTASGARVAGGAAIPDKRTDKGISPRDNETSIHPSSLDSGNRTRTRSARTARTSTPNTQAARTRAKKNPKRRNSDPVSVTSDGRVVFWTGGAPGQGQRLFRRCGSVEAAQETASLLRPELLKRVNRGPKARQSLDHVFVHLRENWVKSNGKQATLNQYRSNWNVWVPREVGTIACDQLTIEHWSTIFTGMNQRNASLGTIKAVTRTLNTVIRHGILNGFFHDENAFGLPTMRTEVVAGAKKRAKATGVAVGEAGGTITPAMCPDVADVERFADAFETHYPGYGRRLVLLAFASGLRFAELLALRVEHLDLTAGLISVEAQLDRSRPWPATRLPKYDKTRHAFLWVAYHPVAASLIDDALAASGEDAGWLFPRHRSTIAWLDQAGRLSTEACRLADWTWRFHYLRHAYATWSLAPATAGGYGLSQKSVSMWLGHSDVSTTLNMYVAEQSNAGAVAMALTQRPPGART